MAIDTDTRPPRGETRRIKVGTPPCQRYHRIQRDSLGFIEQLNESRNSTASERR